MRSFINIDMELFCNTDGDVYPVVVWLDADGDQCEKDSAAIAIAGEEGRWYPLILSDFEYGAKPS